MTVRDIDNFLNWLSTQILDGQINTASALRIGINDLLDTVRDKMFEFKGTFNPATTTLVNGIGRKGDTYKCSVAGSRDFGSGSISFLVKDLVYYDGSVWEKIPTSQLLASAPSAPADGATLAVNGNYRLTNAATYTIASASAGDTTLRIPPLSSAVVTGIGTLTNIQQTGYLVLGFQYDTVWRQTRSDTDEIVYNGITPLTDSGSKEGAKYYASMGSIKKTTRNFGSGNVNVYDEDFIRHNGTVHEVLPSSRLRNPFIRLQDLGLVEGPNATLAESRANSAKLREAIATLRTVYNSSISLTGAGIFVFADEISNVHWPNYAAAKQTVSNAVYDRAKGTITLAAGGWTALALNGPGRVFRIEDDTNSANDGTWITASDHNVNSSYVANDCVYSGGNVYAAPGNVAPGTFNAGQWTLLGSANNVLAVRNHPFTFDGHPKFPVSGTTSSLGIVPLHTTVGGASVGRRTSLAVVAPSSGQLYLRRFAGGPVIRRYAYEQSGVLSQDLLNGPGGVAATQSWWNNDLKLSGVELFTPIGNALYMDGSGHSAAYDILDVNASSKHADFAAVFLDNCYSGQIHSLRIINCAGHGVQAITCNTSGWEMRIEDAGDGVAGNAKHGLYAWNCYGDRPHVNAEGCGGFGMKFNGGDSLISGYVEKCNSGSDYPGSNDFAAAIEVEGEGIDIPAMRVHYSGNQGIHFGVTWKGWKTPLRSTIRPDQKNITFDLSGLAKSLPEGGLSRKRRAIFTLEDYYHYCMSGPRYNGGCGGTPFQINEGYFENTWNTDVASEFPANTFNNTYVGLEAGALRWRFPANSHGSSDFTGSRSIRWMDRALPATNQSQSAFTWVNSGGASVAFTTYDYGTKSPYKVTVTGVDWWKLGVRPGMDCNITGFPDDLTGPDNDQNKPFTVGHIRDNILFLHMRKSANGFTAASVTSSLTAITLSFDFPEQKFDLQNLRVEPDDVIFLDVQYTVGAAHAWFDQFKRGKPGVSHVDWQLPAAIIGLGGNGFDTPSAFPAALWNLFARGPGVHRERFFWHNTSGAVWYPRSPTGPSSGITISACKKVNTTHWPSAGPSPLYDLVFSQLDFTICKGSDLGTM